MCFFPINVLRFWSDHAPAAEINSREGNGLPNSLCGNRRYKSALQCLAQDGLDLRALVEPFLRASFEPPMTRPGLLDQHVRIKSIA